MNAIILDHLIQQMKDHFGNHSEFVLKLFNLFLVNWNCYSILVFAVTAWRSSAQCETRFWLLPTTHGSRRPDEELSSASLTAHQGSYHRPGSCHTWHLFTSLAIRLMSKTTNASPCRHGRVGEGIHLIACCKGCKEEGAPLSTCWREWLYDHTHFLFGNAPPTSFLVINVFELIFHRKRGIWTPTTPQLQVM